MGTFPTGVAVITTAWNGELFGATINSLTAVSLEPSMLLFCTSERSATGAAIRRRALFSVNILGQHQSDLPTHLRDSQRTDLKISLLRSAPTDCRCCREPRPNSVVASPRFTGRVITTLSWAKSFPAKRSPAVRSSFTKVRMEAFNAPDPTTGPARVASRLSIHGRNQRCVSETWTKAAVRRAVNRRAPPV